MNELCALCRALRDRSGPNKQPKVENTILFETERFVVMPCLGPLVPGHVQIVSREHHPNLAAMGKVAIAEYDQLTCSLAEKDPFAGQGILEGEHGATRDQKGGACVIHTHIHRIPGLVAYSRIFDEELPLIGSGRQLEDIAQLSSVPYILLRSGFGSEWCAYSAFGIHSQMIRRTLCDELGRIDKNWRAALRPEWIEETVASWQKGMM
ncbi:MAG: HIT family protein [Candidatus Binatia bacterium]